MADTADPAAPLSSGDDAVEQQHTAATDAGADAPSGEPEQAGDHNEDAGDQEEEAGDQEEEAGDQDEEPEDSRSVTELLEQLRRELSDLGISEAQLEAARNLPEVRRVARELAGALVVVLAALTAFAFVNVAAAEGLSRVLQSWLAALALGAFWTVVAGVLLFGFMGRARRWVFWLVLRAPPAEALEELERERDAAAKAARTTLEGLGPALAIQIALAAVPKAGEVAGDVASGVVSGVADIGDGVLDASDDTIAIVAEQIPGGGVVNQVWAVALTPPRFGIRVAATALRRGRPEE
jgi:Putative Actinobacterial Holin-X, holin superfamily III